jgi:DNA-binding PadR family transcriptional regulator
MALRHTLLGILDWSPAHGYALREMARGYSWMYPMTNANIYPALRDLETDGFVTHSEEVREGRLRKVYAITDAGRAELRRWLADESRQRGVFRDPALLKICMLRSGTLEEASRWIERELDETLATCESADLFLKDRGAQLPYFTRLVAEFGRDLAHMRARWLARVLEDTRCGAAPDPA